MTCISCNVFRAPEPRSGCARGPQGPEPGTQVLSEGLLCPTTMGENSRAWAVERPSGALAQPSIFRRSPNPQVLISNCPLISSFPDQVKRNAQASATDGVGNHVRRGAHLCKCFHCEWRRRQRPIIDLYLKCNQIFLGLSLKSSVRTAKRLREGPYQGPEPGSVKRGPALRPRWEKPSRAWAVERPSGALAQPSTSAPNPQGPTADLVFS